LGENIVIMHLPGFTSISDVFLDGDYLNLFHATFLYSSWHLQPIVLFAFEPVTDEIFI
jgi:hypothetical protein